MESETRSSTVAPLVACGVVGCAAGAFWLRARAGWTGAAVLWPIALTGLLIIPVVGAWRDAAGAGKRAVAACAALALLCFSLDRLFGAASSSWLTIAIGAVATLAAAVAIPGASSDGETRHGEIAAGTGAVLGVAGLAALAEVIVVFVGAGRDTLFWLAILFGIAGSLWLAVSTERCRPVGGLGFTTDAVRALFEGRDLGGARLFALFGILAGWAFGRAFAHMNAFETPDFWRSWAAAPAAALALATAGAWLTSRWVPVFGAKRCLALALILAAAAAAGLTIARVAWEAAAMAGVIAASSGVAAASALSLNGRLAPPARRGFSLGVFVAMACWGVALARPWPSGTLWLWFSLALFAAALAALQALRVPVEDYGEEAPDSRWEWRDAKLAGLARHTVVSRAIQWSARCAAEIFFGRLRVFGHQRLVREGGVILVANHPNTFLDPMLVAALAPGRLHYWAKATLWRFPILGSILDRLGAIPVHRRQDRSSHGHGVDDNQQALGAAARALNRGAHVLIFPEGVSEAGLSLKPVKTGAARLGFQALAEGDWGDDLAMIPIGVDYAEPTVFRSDVTVRVGEPILLREWRQAYEEDPRQAVRAATDLVSGRLKGLLPHLDEPALEGLVQRVQTLYGEQLLQILGERDTTAARRAIVAAVNHYQEMDPDTLWLFNRRVETYFAERERLSTPENHEPIPPSALLKILGELFSFASFGLAANWAPYRLTGRAAEGLETSTVWLASAKLGLGALIFGAYYALVGGVVYLAAGPLLAGAAVATLALSGLAALGSLDRFAFRLRQIRVLWQAFWTQDTNDDLENMKLALIQDLERFREAYAFFRDKEETRV